VTCVIRPATPTTTTRRDASWRFRQSEDRVEKQLAFASLNISEQTKETTVMGTRMQGIWSTGADAIPSSLLRYPSPSDWHRVALRPTASFSYGGVTHRAYLAEDGKGVVDDGFAPEAVFASPAQWVRAIKLRHETNGGTRKQMCCDSEVRYPANSDSGSPYRDPRPSSPTERETETTPDGGHDKQQDDLVFAVPRTRRDRARRAQSPLRDLGMDWRDYHPESLFGLDDEEDECGTGECRLIWAPAQDDGDDAFADVYLY